MPITDVILKEILQHVKNSTPRDGDCCSLSEGALPESLSKYPYDIVGGIIGIAVNKLFLVDAHIENILGDKFYELTELGERELSRLRSLSRNE